MFLDWAGLRLDWVLGPGRTFFIHVRVWVIPGRATRRAPCPPHTPHFTGGETKGEGKIVLIIVIDTAFPRDPRYVHPIMGYRHTI